MANDPIGTRRAVAVLVRADGGGRSVAIQNQTSGVINVLGDESMRRDGNAVSWTNFTLSNAGALRKTAGAGLARIDVNSGTNTGSITAQSGELRFSGPITQTEGELVLSGGAMGCDNALTLNGGVLRGFGTVKGSLSNNATVRVGTPVGRIAVEGSYSQGTSGILEIELGGTNAGTEFDQLAVTGAVSLGGKLQLTRVSSYTPATPAIFDVVTYSSRTGSFAATEGSDLGLGLDLRSLADASHYWLWIFSPAPPAFTTHPLSQSVLVGGAVSFVVTVSGGPPPTVQWRKNGSDIAGATGTTLTLSECAGGCGRQLFCRGHE